MILTDKIFKLLYESRDITDERLATFMEFLISALKADNTGGKHDTMIALVTGALDNLRAKLGGVDTGISIQKGKTKTVEQIIADFEDVMKNKYANIEVALGGKDTPEMLEFYPHGKTEYNNITREDMPLLTNRIKDAAGRNATALGVSLTDALSAFASLWTNKRKEQTDKMEEVDAGETQVTDARDESNIASHKATHYISEMYPGDVEKCKTFCAFHLLYAQSHSAITVYEGTIAPDQTAIAFNKIYPANAEYRIMNLSDNAEMNSWMAVTAEESHGNDFLRNEPNQTHNVTREELHGNENTPYLMIQNRSTTNPVHYRIEVK